ncbi:MAG: MFS transporter [Anaerolineae bacterium]
MSKNEAISPQELPGRGEGAQTHAASQSIVPAQTEAEDRRVEERSQAGVMGRTFEALKYPNYRLWFMGQLVSLVGTWMQTTAQGFLIFQLTHSTAYLGYVGFAAGIPSWVFMLYGGVVADRVSRRNLLIITQTSMMILAFIQAGLTFLNIIQPWQIIVLAFMLGIANAFDAPARQAFVLELVDRRALTNAIALNSGMFNAATVVGPAVAGLTYAAFGAAWCFTINGLSFIAVIVALALMHIKNVARAPRTGRTLDQLKEGLNYTLSHPMIRTLIAVAGVGALFGGAYATLLPAWAVDVLGGDAMTNGLLQSARGVGSLIGALMIASMGPYLQRGKLLTFGTFVYPVLLIFFALVQWLPLSLVVLAGVGWGAMVVFNMANTLVQTQVSDVLRGRVMGVYTLTFFGGMPLGALWAGALANYIGAPWTIIISGVISLAFAFVFWIFVPRLRALA